MLLAYHIFNFNLYNIFKNIVISQILGFKFICNNKADFLSAIGSFSISLENNNFLFNYYNYDLFQNILKTFKQLGRYRSPYKQVYAVKFRIFFLTKQHFLKFIEYLFFSIFKIFKQGWALYFIFIFGYSNCKYKYFYL